MIPNFVRIFNTYKIVFEIEKCDGQTDRQTDRRTRLLL